ncbi:DUF2491 family protein [Solimicrobium silvestre]|uniref:DUF2491 family protein n=1 Tax=Solimicrobium silvestre TaxID=2099400 RepID=A0A2S9GX04_9BURK|nr:DUF2491 family protein [Solimicrobium silvestre]PRC92253.1 hypothetical protein S2091_2912 [Solimicrobium silvestre]
MSWKDAFQYGKAVLANHGVEAAKDAPRADDALPLGARIGALIKLQQSPFIRANANGSLIAMPDQAEATIRAISHVKLNLSGQLYRYYLSLGDSDDEAEIFLQLFQDEHGAISELMYCTRLTRLIPQTAEEQEAYTGESGFGLGEKTYAIWKEQLADLGYSEAELSAVFGDAENVEYRRDVGAANVDFVTPFNGIETRIDDTAGEHGLKQEIYFMPYVRNLADGLEYLLISTEIVESQNGDSDKRAIHVNFMIGLALEAERVVIQ